MQSVLSRIWTWVAVFISYDDNDYTTGNKTKRTSHDVPSEASVDKKNKYFFVCENAVDHFANSEILM